jgi:hypothetical protein
MPFLARPARKPRTVCEAQPIASAICGPLAPSRRRSMGRTWARFVFRGCRCGAEAGRPQHQRPITTTYPPNVFVVDPATRSLPLIPLSTAIGQPAVRPRSVRCGGRIKWSSRVVARASTARAVSESLFGLSAMMKLLKAGPIIGRCYQAEPRRRNPVGAAGRSWSGCVLAFVESGFGNPAGPSR